MKKALYLALATYISFQAGQAIAAETPANCPLKNKDRHGFAATEKRDVAALCQKPDEKRATPKTVCSKDSKSPFCKRRR